MSASSLASAAFTTPLAEERMAALGRVTQGLDAQGLWWLSGYAAGLASGSHTLIHDAPIHEAPAPEASPAGLLTIVYGSQTGNAKRLAEQLARQG